MATIKRSTKVALLTNNKRDFGCACFKKEIMTPKEKAIELYNIFDMIIYSAQGEHYQCKRCAIRCVEQMILSHEIWATEQDEYLDYYNDVKHELSLL